MGNATDVRFSAWNGTNTAEIDIVRQDGKKAIIFFSNVQVK